MIVLKIITILLGIAFTSFGYLIYFRKKYFLINGFEKNFKSGKKNEKYAKRVGLTELIVGTIFLLIGIILIVFA